MATVNINESGTATLNQQAAFAAAIMRPLLTETCPERLAILREAIAVQLAALQGSEPAQAAEAEAPPAPPKAPPGILFMLDLVQVPELRDDPFDAASAQACLEAMPEEVREELSVTDAIEWVQLPKMQRGGHWARALAIWQALPLDLRKRISPQNPTGWSSSTSLRACCQRAAESLGITLPK